MKYWKLEDWLVIFLSIAIVFLLVIYIIASIENEKEWQAFKADHDCRVVERSDGDIHTGVGVVSNVNGQPGTVVTVSSTPDKEAWLCDDGITYWKNAR